jgi:hypothetical protein
MPSIAPPKPNLNTGFRSPSQKLTLHFSTDKKVVCQAECQLTPDTRFVEIPFPVIHQMARGSMK